VGAVRDRAELSAGRAPRPSRGCARRAISPRSWRGTTAAATARSTATTGCCRARRSPARRRRHARGYPIRRTARRKPREKAPRSIDYACETFTRGPYEWRIDRAGATVRTYSGRGYARRYHVKQLASVEKARASMEQQIRAKRREGYVRDAKAGNARDDDFVAAAARHLATLAVVGQRR
jgi:hypothetical protein